MSTIQNTTSQTKTTNQSSPVTTLNHPEPQPTLSFAEPPTASALVPTNPPHGDSAQDHSTDIDLALQFSNTALSSPQSLLPGKPRNGKVAHLPKLERDLVNRMLANNLPHAKIVCALDECGFHVTERNISNWKTHGGYREWCVAQQRALELRSFQDNLTSFLRRHDATELPEVGLQSAATSLSAILIRPDLMQQLISQPEKYAKLIEMQCRLTREIQSLQKNRDDAAKALGRDLNPELIRRQDEADVERLRKALSSKSGRSIREPDIPHRNFIRQDLDPVPVEPPKPPSYQEIRSYLAQRAAGSQPKAPPATPGTEKLKL